MNAEQATPYPPLAVLNFHALRMTRKYGPDNEMVQLRDKVNALVEALRNSPCYCEDGEGGERDIVCDRCTALAPFGGAA